MRYLSFLAALTSLGSAFALSVPQRRDYGVITSCSKHNTAALTFDDGPFEWTDKVGDMLSEAGAKGTFFVNGGNYECIYLEHIADRLLHVYHQGHQIASHTWRHKNLAELSYDQVANEMDKLHEAVSKITGATPAFTRPPYGSVSDTVFEVAAAKGQTLVNWDFDTRDGTGAGPEESKSLYDDVVNRRPPSILTLAHETQESSVFDVLPYAIKKLQAAGYDLVTVAECLGEKPYLHVDKPGKRDWSWKCH